MNSELPSKSVNQLQSLDERFADKPHVRQRLLEIADMIDTLVAQGCTAHEAEARAIEQIRKLGQGILTESAEKSEQAAVTKALAKDPKVQNYVKKTPELSLDLRADCGARATVASRPARGAVAPLL